MTDPKKACRKCYAHADGLDEALAAGPSVVAQTGTLHKVSEEDPAKTECGQDITDTYSTVATVEVDAVSTATESTATTSTADTDPNTTEEITRSRPGVPATGARRARRRHIPPSGRR